MTPGVQESKKASFLWVGMQKYFKETFLLQVSFHKYP